MTAKSTTKYNPNLVRRRVRRIESTPGQVQHFKSYSLTRPGTEVEHHPVVDLQTGEVTCTCEHFRYRLAQGNPTVFSPAADLCKHLIRALGILERNGELPQQNGQFAARCIHCAAEGAEIEVVDDSGNMVIGRACQACIEAQTDDLSDFDEYAPFAHEYSCAPTNAEMEAHAAACAPASNFTMSADERSAKLQARIDAGLVSADDLF